MAYRMKLGPGGKIYFGGHFDAAKLEGYKAELQQRAGICQWALEVMQQLYEAIQKLPLDEPASGLPDAKSSR